MGVAAGLEAAIILFWNAWQLLAGGETDVAAGPPQIQLNMLWAGSGGALLFLH